MATLKQAQKRLRMARKAMLKPENQKALKKGLERLKRVYTCRVVGTKKVLVVDTKARKRERTAGAAKGARRSR